MNELQMLTDTLDIFEAGSYVKNDQSIALKLTQNEMREAIVLLPDRVKQICEHPAPDNIRGTGRAEYFCVNEDSLSATRKVKKNHPEEKVLVLNFANPVFPGGGVRKGMRAQEEDLCRKSSLLLSLEAKAAEEYYKYNSSLETCMGSDAIIISPSVEIIRDASGDLLDETVVVAAMTCAAPMITLGWEGMTEAEYEQMFYNRIVATLKVAANYGYRHLVLGAWGCGAFGNDARVISTLYYKAFKELDFNGMSHEDLFSEVYFAVLDRSVSKYNFNAFNRYFEDFYKE